MRPKLFYSGWTVSSKVPELSASRMFWIESKSNPLSRLPAYLEAIKPKHLARLIDFEDPYHFSDVRQTDWLKQQRRQICYDLWPCNSPLALSQAARVSCQATTSCLTEVLTSCPVSEKMATTGEGHHSRTVWGIIPAITGFAVQTPLLCMQFPVTNSCW